MIRNSELGIRNWNLFGNCNLVFVIFTCRGLACRRPRSTGANPIMKNNPDSRYEIGEPRSGSIRYPVSRIKTANVGLPVSECKGLQADLFDGSYQLQDIAEVN